MVDKLDQTKKPASRNGSASNKINKTKDEINKTSTNSTTSASTVTITDKTNQIDNQSIRNNNTLTPSPSPIPSPKVRKTSKLSLRTPTPSPSPRYCFHRRLPKSNVQIIVDSDCSDDDDDESEENTENKENFDNDDDDDNNSNNIKKLYPYNFLKPDQNNNHNNENNDDNNDINTIKSRIPEVLRSQGSDTYCSSNPESNCPCNTSEGIGQISKQIQYTNRKTWISVERMNELRKRAQEALKHHKTFTIRGCFFSIRNALTSRGWVEKLDAHRKHVPNGICQITYEDLAQTLPKRKPEHMPIDFLWTARKEKCDYIDQAKNPSMIINKFQRIPFTSKEGLCTSLKDFHWFYEEGVSELYFPRCFNVWSPEELSEFIDNFRLSACIAFIRWIVDKYRINGFDAIFSSIGKIPFTAIDFAIKRCSEYLDISNHNDIDNDETVRIWEHDFDAFLTQHYLITQENGRILSDPNRTVDITMKTLETIVGGLEEYWPQYNLDGYLNLWIVKPANKCRGRGIHIFDNLKKVLNMVNPNIASKSRYVVQKYIEKPLIIHNTKFDIRQWFLVTSTQPMVIWMYKECYLRFSSQEYNLTNHHESVHLTNHAIQKKYKNGKRDKRLPSENMWDCYSFQAYLRQIGKHLMWSERIYPGMKKAIIGTMLASQESMDRRTNTFELFGADFMISEDFNPWLIEINSSPDLGATTSVTARMCPACLEDVIKVVIDRRYDIKADTGNFECIYRQIIPPTPAYMGLNLSLKGKQIIQKNSYLTRTNRDRPTAISTLYSARKSMPSIQILSSLNGNNEQNKNEKSSNSNLLNDIDNNSIRNNDNENDETLIKKAGDIISNSVLKKSNFNFIRTSAINTLTMLDLNSFGNVAYHTRLLTPLTTPQSSRRSSTQLLISPRCSNSSEIKKRSNDLKQNLFEPTLSNKSRAQNQNISKGKLQYKAPKRHLSCGPKIIPHVQKNDNDNLSGYQRQNNNQIENNKENLNIINSNNAAIDSSIECIGSKCSMENLNLPESEGNSVVTPSPRPITPNKRKQIFDVLCKPRTSRIRKVVKSSIKTKSSPVIGSSAVISYRKSGISNRKSSANNDKSSPSIRNNKGLNIRTWRTKQQFKDENMIKGKSASPSKYVPPISPVRKKNEENLYRRCSTCKKPTLYKNISAKVSSDISDRINTRC
ncbi:uncharacterized protein LOC129615259 isoform X2 [Condylostylus longicornis]|uniref:uncharacterized protein LOC129615259 isoform X2 n=1 Tax=Condylostylus longicornis TaxID=2530218 RepID=UPI00244E3A20|nr:uncharacterized protein LOC129615259 isoform X2 [Condylostylus longicornis]